MNSLGDDCHELKKQYDACFNGWFKENFLKGKSNDSMVPCAPLFKIYQDCVKRAMREQKLEVREVDGEYTIGDYENSSGSAHSKS